MFDLARWRKRYGWLDGLLRLNERFGAIGGGHLAASIGLTGFLSLFPLLLVLIAVVGFVASGNTEFTAQVIDRLSLDGQTAEVVTNAISTAETSRRTATVIGLAGLLWAGLSVVASLQAACNAAWQTTGRGLVDRAVSLAWLAAAGSLFVGSVVLGPVVGLLPGYLAILTIVAGLALTTTLFVWTYSFLGNQPLPWRAHLPGALLVAVGFELLKVIGTVYVPRAIAASSALYGAIGVVFATLVWMLLYARLVVYGAVLNVMRWEAERGTVTVEIEVPRIGDDVPLVTNRGGAVIESTTKPA